MVKRVMGLDRNEVDRLFLTFLPVWVAQERDRPDRQRAVGGGRRSTLTVQDRLVMVLTWLRLYLNTEALRFFFRLNPSHGRRNCRRPVQVVRTVGDETLDRPEFPTRGKGKRGEEALQECPDLPAMVVPTAQRIRRPRDNDRQEQHASGKNKAHTRQTGLVVNEHGRIRAVTASTPGGAMHDRKHVVEAGVVKRVPPDVAVIGDAGFDGLQNSYPERSIGTPHKARRTQPLTLDQKWANREVSSVRSVVENPRCQRKPVQVLTQQVRHAVARDDDVFPAVVGVINDRFDRRMRQVLGAETKRAEGHKPFPFSGPL